MLFWDKNGSEMLLFIDSLIQASSIYGISTTKHEQKRKKLMMKFFFFG